MDSQSQPWLAIQRDGDVKTVLVQDRHLLNFPHFMRHIIETGVGMEEGVFKIQIVEGKGGATASEILDFVGKYFNKKSNGAQLKVQTFHQSPWNNQNLYGYLEALNTPSAAKKVMKNFRKLVCNPQTFLEQSSCCLQVLSKGVEPLVKHYWEELAKVASKGSFSEEIVYAAGIPVDRMSLPVTSSFCLSKLNTILDLIPVKIPGLSYPYLYVGSKHASFPWHIEDAALFSINYLHFGAPCVWFFVPPQFYKKFVEIIHHFPLALAQTTCVNVLGHKYVVASKDLLTSFGIPVHTIVQKENELVVSYPYAAHSGFKCGSNLQTAVNFADPWWVQLGMVAPTCSCFPTNVQLDLRDMITAVHPDLLQIYSYHDTKALIEVLAKNQYVTKLGLVPSLMEVDEQVKEIPDESPEVEQAESTSTTTTTSTPVFQHARCIIACPSSKCGLTMSGGRGRLPRMVEHIDKAHKRDQSLKDQLSHLYPPKTMQQTKGSTCNICNVFISGNNCHMKRHLQRKH